MTGDEGWLRLLMWEEQKKAEQRIQKWEALKRREEQWS